MKKSRNIYNNEKEISDETISTCSSHNCFSDEILSSTRQSDKKRGGRKRDKSIPIESERSNKYLGTNLNGRRVRKRISRGVQTAVEPKKKITHRVKKRICNYFKFKWRSKKEREEVKQTRSKIATGETPAVNAEEKNIEVIHKPRRNSRRDNDIQDTKSGDRQTSDTNDKKTKEKPVQTNGNNMQKKNYNRKYDFSIDGTDVEVIRTEKSGAEEKMSDLSKKSTHPSTAAANSQEKISNTRIRRRKRRARSKQNARKKKAAVANERNLLVTEEGEDNKSKTQETVTGRDEAVDKRGKIEGPRKLKNINNRALNSEEKDAAHTVGKRDKSVVSDEEKPAATKEETVRSREPKKSPSFKLFVKSGRKSVTSGQPSNEESHDDGRRNINPRKGEPVRKQLDARRNDIAEVKKRLDNCIADLNEIILNLSKVFEQVPASGAGPGGEGNSSGNINRSRRGRSRLN